MVWVLSCVMALSGCETLHPPAPGANPQYAPTYPVGPDPKDSRYVQGSIYNADTALPLFETPRARHAGDIVTVILMEKTDAKKQAKSRGTKNEVDNIVNKTFLGRPIALGGGYSFDFDLNAQRNFTGEGESSQNNKLAGSISVTVAKVLPNGNMVIQGEKWIRINQGNEFIQLSGIIRPQDIQPDNTISSDRVANARISYGGTGQVNNANVQGWAAKILWSPLFPI